MKKSLFKVAVVGALLASAFVAGTLCGGKDRAPLAEFGNGAHLRTAFGSPATDAFDSRPHTTQRTFDVQSSADSRFQSVWQAWTSPNIYRGTAVTLNVPSLEELLGGEKPTGRIPWDGVARYSLKWNEERGWFVFFDPPKVIPPQIDLFPERFDFSISYSVSR